MSVKIRLTRLGMCNRPFYRIIIADARFPRDGRFIEKIGYYDPIAPKTNESRVVINLKRFDYWVSTGAIPTKVVKRLVKNIKNPTVVNAS